MHCQVYLAIATSLPSGGSEWREAGGVVCRRKIPNHSLTPDGPILNQCNRLFTTFIISHVKKECGFFGATVTGFLVCFLSCIFASAQATAIASQSPREVVLAYRRMDADGMRLTPSGWNKGNSFFLHPAPPPHDRVLGVIATGENIGEATVNGDRAEVWTEFDFIGNVYPDGRFSRSIEASPPVRGPVSSRRKYVLVHAGAARGASEWKIEDFEPNPMVSVHVAIQYLERLRDATDKDDIRKNANRSISELSALQNRGAK
jgi:hypothetical protein